MTWIADQGVAALAAWVALILSGVVAGASAARWNAPSSFRAPGEGVVLGAAAAGVIAWCAQAGTLLGGTMENRLLDAFVPTSVPAGTRLAALWSTAPGSALTLATVIMVWSALMPVAARDRQLVASSVMALGGFGAAIGLVPAPGDAARTLPAFALSPYAAIAALGAVAALAMLAMLVILRAAGTVGSFRGLSVGAWVAATLALAAEQVTRSQLGIGPRDPVVLGSASSGLIVWLICSALLHQRVRAFALGVPHAPMGGWSPPAVTGHLGAACVVLSFVLHAVASRSTVSLPAGTTTEVNDAFGRPWRLVNQGISRYDTDGVEVTALAIEAVRPSGRADLLAPEVREYHDREGRHFDTPVLRRAETGGVTHTLRVLFTGADSLDVASVRVTFLPLPVLWPLGVGLLMLAAVLTALPGRRMSTVT